MWRHLKRKEVQRISCTSSPGKSQGLCLMVGNKFFAGLMFQQCKDDLALSGMPCVEAEMETSAREYLSKIARVVLAELETAFTTGFDS